jgi:methionine-rich copper-binding protein CopC
MKTPRKKSILAVLIALILFVYVSTALAHRTVKEQSGPVLPASAYSELVNGLTAGGR